MKKKQIPLDLISSILDAVIIRFEVILIGQQTF